VSRRWAVQVLWATHAAVRVASPAGVVHRALLRREQVSPPAAVGLHATHTLTHKPHPETYAFAATTRNLAAAGSDSRIRNDLTESNKLPIPEVTSDHIRLPIATRTDSTHSGRGPARGVDAGAGDY